MIHRPSAFWPVALASRLPRVNVRRADVASAAFAVVAGLAVYAALRPALALTHELFVYVIARGLASAAGAVAGWPGLSALPLDPVYTGAALGYLEGAPGVGVAVAGQLGDWLHANVGGLWLAPAAVAPGASVSAIFPAGAPLLGRTLAAFGADVVLLGAGLWLSVRPGRSVSWYVVLGCAVQAHVLVGHLWRDPVTVDAIEAMGVPFAVATIAGKLFGPQPWFTASLATVPSPWRESAGAALLSIAAYFLAGCGLLIGRAVRRGRRFGVREEATGVRGVSRVLAVRATLLAAAFGFLLTPLVPPAGAESASVTVGAARGSEAPPYQEESTESSAGTEVRIEATGNGGFRYLVNGRPKVIRGMGYNPRYAALDDSARRALYERDFGQMRAAGINTIEGWFEGEFDEVTLDAAAANGLGVLMPFELNQDLDYGDPAVRDRLTNELLAIVERYRHHPAVRMWAPGNENLHRILFPNWVSRVGDPAAEARAANFARFYVDLIDRVHQADPKHPVIYRDAEEVYLGRLRPALAERQSPRPWLVYGTNVYTARLETILREWPTRGLGTPLVVSEFAPAGVAPADKPARFGAIWATIRQYPDWVIGGLAYTWCSEGPEELDRVFGLVGPDGVARDGSLAELSDLFRRDRRASPAAVAP